MATLPDRRKTGSGQRAPLSEERAMTPERLALEMGLDIPDFDRIGYYGADYGTMKPFHRAGCLLFLSGHVAQIGAEITHKGRLGADLTTAQGYAAARLGPDRGLGGRATIGVMALAGGVCFETWATVEIAD